MQFRVVTLNLEQDHKRWSDRHPLISAEIAGLRPDVIALNEVSVPLQTARLLRDTAIAATGIPYKLVHRTDTGRSALDGRNGPSCPNPAIAAPLSHRGKPHNSRLREISLTRRSGELILTFIKMKEPPERWRRKPHSTPSRRSARRPGSTYSGSSSQSDLKGYQLASLPSA